MQQATGARLRKLLAGPSIAVLGGAHDALSARLVQEAEFDGVWASSFGISLASRCMPDADLLTMTETLEVVSAMAATIDIPLVADCNAGFGDAINVMRMTREFEHAGVGGICIEDNSFPKRCSLYDRDRRELVSIPEMVGKVKAAKQAQSSSDFVVIARVEALIAGHGLNAALDRAYAYQEAGADALVVHAKQFAILKDFISQWNGTAPLVVIPTLFSHVSLAELESGGFRLAIFPNQAVRAAINAMRSTLAMLRQTGYGQSVESDIAPLSEVFRLVGVDRLEEDERAYGAPRAGLREGLAQPEDK